MIKVDGIDDLINAFAAVEKKYPNEAQKFLNKEGTKLKRVVQKEVNKKTKRKTGNLYNAVTKQKAYKYFLENSSKAKDSVKVYGRRSGKNTLSKKKQAKGQANNKGNHTHLLEEGHNKVLWGNRTADVVRGFYMYKDASREYESTFESNCEMFVDKILGLLD